MSKKTRKVLSFALSVIILLGVVPMNSFTTESVFLENLGGFLNKALSGINASALSFGWNNKTVKPIQDGLVHGGIIKDDNLFNKIISIQKELNAI